MLNIKGLLKGLKLNVKVAIAILKDRKNINKTFTYDMISEDGVIYDYSPISLAQHGVCVAAMGLVQFGMLNIKPRFMYDDLYLQMSENGQQFVKHHEMGHYNLHQSFMLAGGGRDIKMEYEADEYAASMMGTDKAVKGLEELRDLINTLNFGHKHFSTEEVDLRIKNIKRLVEVK